MREIANEKIWTLFSFTGVARISHGGSVRQGPVGGGAAGGR